jgi:hypothetical protein
MPENRLFVSGALLDRWVTVGQVELEDGILKVKPTGTAYTLEEAARVVGEATGAGDAQGLVGRVRTLAELSALGAEVLDCSVLLGEFAYDVVPGFIAAPAGDRGGERISSERLLHELSALSEAPKSGQSDEELLARFLIEKL